MNSDLKTKDHTEITVIPRRDVYGQFKNAGRTSVHAVGSVLGDFKTFVNKGNVVDLAVGIVMGAAFTAIVSSLVKDLITPILSLASPSNTLSEQFVVLRYLSCHYRLFMAH